MSKRHQSSRRRSYGRRQHELHERFDRQPVAVMAEHAEDLDGSYEREVRFELAAAPRIRPPHLPASPMRAPLSFAVAD